VYVIAPSRKRGFRFDSPTRLLSPSFERFGGRLLLHGAAAVLVGVLELGLININDLKTCSFASGNTFTKN
jgi:hypothetical protein